MIYESACPPLSLYAHYILTLSGRCLAPNVQLPTYNWNSISVYTSHTKTRSSSLSILRTALSPMLNNSTNTSVRTPRAWPSRGRLSAAPGQRHTARTQSSEQGPRGPSAVLLEQWGLFGWKGNGAHFHVQMSVSSQQSQAPPESGAPGHTLNN